MAASQSVLNRILAAACATVALCASSFANDDVGERYRALTAALARSDFDAAIAVAETLTGEDAFARKASGWLEAARFLKGSAEAPRNRAATAEAGALRLTLAEDFAFSAYVIGQKGFTPLLGSPFDPFSSRLTVNIDGESFAPRPTPVQVFPGGARVLVIERDVEIVLTIFGGAPPVGHPAAESSSVRVEATVINRGATDRRIGMRLLVDVAFGFDDAPVLEWRPGAGIPLTREWIGDEVPRRLTFGARSIVLRGNGAPAAERVEWVPTASALERSFDLPFTEGEPLGADSALALFAEPISLGPGMARSVAIDLVPNGEDRNGAQPLSTGAYVEPVAGNPRATRVLLALSNESRGITGAFEDLSITPRVAAGLDLLSGSSRTENYGDLEPFALLQRSIVVVPNGTRGGAQDVFFDLAFGRADRRSTRSIAMRIDTPNAADLAGRIVDVKGTAIADAEVVLLADGRELGRTRSDGSGLYRFSGLPIREYEVRASKVVFVQPAAKAARADVDDVMYDVVLSSETVENDGSHRLPRLQPGEGKDVVLARSLTRFSILVVTQWDADREYLELIARGMRKAAEFLYAASDGQFTFGRVAIRDCARDWNSADLWDWSNNSVHPNASVAGIGHRFDAVHAPWNTAMNFGRNWERGTWETHGVFSTVVHEFGHYGFGLYDEYLGAPQGVHRGLSYPEMCRCIMGYQYADFKICFEPHHRTYTNQGMWNGRSCWKQLEDQYEGWRGGVYVPVLTPIERNGVLPPPIPNHIGNDLAVVIRDESTNGYVAVLDVVNPMARSAGGIPVAIESSGESVYQGVTRGDGSIDLMGVHVGDRVVATYSGARAEFVVRERAPRYRLEFGDDVADDRPAPRIVFFPERRTLDGSPELPLGTLEIESVLPLAEPPRVFLDASGGAAVVRAIDASQNHFVANLPFQTFRNGRATLDCELRTLSGETTHAWIDITLGRGRDGVVAFDGSLEFELEGAPDDALLAITSVAGPADRLVDASGVEARSVGRTHAITALPERLGTGTIRLRRPFEVGSADLIPATERLASGAFAEHPGETLEDGSRRIELPVPSRVAWFGR